MAQRKEIVNSVSLLPAVSVHPSYWCCSTRKVFDSTAAIAPQFWSDITNNSGLLRFQDIYLANLLFPLHVKNVKPFQLQGGFAP